jgi:hypothetical protein
MFGLKEILGAVVLSSFVAGGVSAMTGPAIVKNDRIAVTSVDRTKKGDRLPQASVLQQRWNATSGFPASSTRIPLGCDAAFSPIADPARARIFKRCVA